MRDTISGATTSGAAPRRTAEVRISELERFVAEHQRLPRRSGPPSERSLYEWVGHIRRGQNLEVKAELDRRVAGWGTVAARTLSKRTLERIAELERFVAEHHRLPRRRGSVEERSLYGWVIGTRNRGREKVKAELDQRVPGWEARPSNSAIDERVAELRQFVTEHDRLPRAKTSGVSQEEASLARWLEKVRARRPTHAVDRLDQEVPGWDTPAEYAWEKRLSEAHAVLQEAGALPPTTPGNTLGRWLRTQREAARTGRYGWNPRREQRLNEVLPGWTMAPRLTRASK